MTESQWLSSEDPRAMLADITAHAGEAGVALRHRASDRKLRLFACACCRLFPTHKEMFAVDASERFADGLMTPKELHKASQRTVGGGTWAVCHAEASEAARYVISDGHFRQSLPQLAALLRDIVGNPHRLPPYVWMNERLCPRPERERLIGDYIGDLHPVDWLTPQVLLLAEAAYSERGRDCDGGCEGVMDRNLRRRRAIYESAGPESRWTDCPRCHGTGVTDGGTLDPFRLALLADALEEAGCVGPREDPCKPCGGHGTEMQVAPDRGPAPKCSFCGGKKWRDWPHPLLAHLRSPGPHYRGMWSLDLILGKS